MSDNYMINNQSVHDEKSEVYRYFVAPENSGRADDDRQQHC